LFSRSEKKRDDASEHVLPSRPTFYEKNSIMTIRSKDGDSVKARDGKAGNMAENNLYL
jgi:hypothetical protein